MFQWSPRKNCILPGGLHPGGEGGREREGAKKREGEEKEKNRWKDRQTDRQTVCCACVEKAHVYMLVNDEEAKKFQEIQENQNQPESSNKE